MTKGTDPGRGNPPNATPKQPEGRHHNQPHARPHHTPAERQPAGAQHHGNGPFGKPVSSLHK